MSQTSRISHLDSLRGVAVLLMVMVHSAATWNPFKGDQETLLAYLVSGLGGLAAPLFLTLFGWGMLRVRLTIKARIFNKQKTSIHEFTFSRSSKKVRHR